MQELELLFWTDVVPGVDQVVGAGPQCLQAHADRVHEVDSDDGLLLFQFVAGELVVIEGVQEPDHLLKIRADLVVLIDGRQ